MRCYVAFVGVVVCGVRNPYSRNGIAWCVRSRLWWLTVWNTALLLFFRMVSLILIHLQICKPLLLMATFLLHLLISLKRLTRLVFGNTSMRAVLHTKMRRRKRVLSKIGNRFLNQQFIHISYFKGMLPFWLLCWHGAKSTNYAPHYENACVVLMLV